MVSKKQPSVKNPLTVIAIFAGIAEASGAAVLPFLDAQAQNIYVWFLISFPLLLIILFFLTLNFNNKVLYAPSDYQDENNFLKIQQMSAKQVELKYQKELELYHETAGTLEMVGVAKASKVAVGDSTESESSVSDSSESSASDSSESVSSESEVSVRSRYLLAEQIALASIEEEIGVMVHSNVAIQGPHRSYPLDGYADSTNAYFAIEVVYVRKGQPIKQIDMSVQRARSMSKGFFKQLKDTGILMDKQLHLIVACVFDEEKDLENYIKFFVPKERYFSSKALKNKIIHLRYQFFTIDGKKHDIAMPSESIH